MIKIDKVSRVYDGETPVRALDEVDFTLPEKGMVFVVGKSGSGKSTLLNVLAGFDKPTAGSILFNNKKISDLSNKELDYYRNSTIGFVFQDYCLIESFTAYQNIRMSFDYKNEKSSRKEIDEILDSVGMKGYGKRYPKQLSAGQKQRIAIARCLAKNPKVILADEPTGNLDSKTTVQILELLKEISKERLIVVVSHNKNDAYKYGDRIIEMSNGKIVSYKYRNENFVNEYISGDDEIILPAKGRLSNEQLEEVNSRIKSSKGTLKLKRGLDEFLDYESKDIPSTDYINEKTKMGFLNLLKYSWMFFKNHILSFMLVVLIVVCLIVTLSLSIQFSNYNGELQYKEIIEENDFDSMVIRNLTPAEVETGEIDDFGIEFDDETLNKLLQKNDIEYYELYSYNLPVITSWVSHRVNISYGITKGVVQGSSSLVVCDKTLLKSSFGDESGNVKLKAGEIKENSDGIIITDYLADCLIAAFSSKGIVSYEAIVLEETYLLTTYGVKIDAVIDTNYAETYKDVIEEVKKGIDEVTDEYSEFMDYLFTKLAFVYTINPNYYQGYIKNVKALKPEDQMSYVYKQVLSTDSYKIETEEARMYFREYLNENELILSYDTYNTLFNTNCSKTDLSEFEKKKVTLTLYDSDNKCFVDEEFEIIELTPSGTYASFDIREKIIDVTYERTGIYAINNGKLGELVSYAVENDLLVDSSRMTVVQKAVSVVAVFEDLFTLLLVLMIIAIIVLVVIHTINTYNKNIYNIGVSKSMGAHMSELSFIFAIQMIVFGGLIIALSLVADYYSTNLINDIISNAIPRIVDIPGANTITYLYYNPVITSVSSGLIVVLTIAAIIVPLMAIRVMNPVNIIKSRQ